MFRNHKFNNPLCCKGFSVTTLTLVNDGNGSFDVVQKLVNELNASIPDPDDYRLQDLLLAGVPLQPVSVSLDNSPSQENIENFVNNNLNVEENEN